MLIMSFNNLTFLTTPPPPPPFQAAFDSKMHPLTTATELQQRGLCFVTFL